MLEDEGRAEFMLGVAEDAKDTGILERFQDLKLAQGGPLKGFSLSGGLAAYVVQPHPALAAGDADQRGAPILVAWAFANDSPEPVITDGARPLRGPDTGLLKRLGHQLAGGPVVGALGELL